MPQALYRVTNGPSPTTAPTPKVTTGTSTKTLLQLTHASLPLSIVEWGISFDGSAAATPIECELIDTGTIAATVTAYVANDVTALTDPGGTAATINLGTAASGYTASAEGSVAAPVRIGDYQLVAPTNQYLKQFPLGQEFNAIPGHMIRIRVTAAAAVSAVCYVTFAIG
jgi:hypothetical protein